MLLDTSGLLCLMHEAEASHKQAVSLYRTSHQRLTTSYVLTEYVALATTRRLPRRTVLAFTEAFSNDPAVEVIWVNEALHREAVSLLLRRQDKTYSLCDAVSFVLMRRYGITEALTTDHHFEQEGFRRLLT